MSEVVGGATEQPAGAPEQQPGTAEQPAGTAAPAAASTAGRGVTTVSSEVVEKIAAGAARSVPGVADLGGDVARFFNTVFDSVGLDQVGDATRGVSAQVKGNTVVVNVVLVIAGGQVVAQVTEAVRAKVIEAVQGYGLEVTAVNVKVDDIEMNGSTPAA